MKNPKLTRRMLFKKTLNIFPTFILAANSLPLFLSACKKNKSQTSSHDSKNHEANNFNPCPNKDKLKEEEKKRRKMLKYTDKSPIKTRTCDNCKLFRLTDKKSLCQGCTIVPGPIHPKGWCMSWVHKM